MVTITGYTKRQNAEGKEFFTLTLMGGVELVKSSKTGNYYATAWKTSITSTFNEDVCRSLVGKALPGEIQRVEVQPYSIVNKETGEVITLSHRYRFNPQPNNPTMEQAVFEPELATAAV